MNQQYFKLKFTSKSKQSIAIRPSSKIRNVCDILWNKTGQRDAATKCLCGETSDQAQAQKLLPQITMKQAGAV